MSLPDTAGPDAAPDTGDFRFEVLSTHGHARRGRLHTPHGSLETPAFMPVGTLGAVKGVPPQTLEELGAEIMLANLYHLSLRPGIDVVEELGGVHDFTGWRRPVLTDSGGYQVFSLSELNTIDEGGVTFKSHLDGARVRFTPENVVSMQARMGVDVAMMLDECPPWPVEEAEAEAAWERTLGWARRARRRAEEATADGGPGGAPWGGALFGIVQGSAFEGLRRRAAAEMAELDFPGYAVGGVSVGEPGEMRRAVVEWTGPALPADKPRYLMGVGYPDDLAHAVAHGIDMFDCVLPARNARHGYLFTRGEVTADNPFGIGEVLKMKNARFRDDPRPVDETCPCPCCTRVSRAFLHHLVRSGEQTGGVLATLHNLRFYLDFMEHLRQAIASGKL